jgi:hypothetical protein
MTSRGAARLPVAGVGIDELPPRSATPLAVRHRAAAAVGQAESSGAGGRRGRPLASGPDDPAFWAVNRTLRGLSLDLGPPAGRADARREISRLPVPGAVRASR